VKFILTKDNILKPLNSLVSLANNKTTMPILSCILFNYEDNILKLTASDSEIEISTNVKLTVEKNFKIALNSSKLISIIKSMPDESEIIFSLEKNNKVVIFSGNIRFEMISLDANNFPFIQTKLNKEPTFSTSQLSMYNLIHKVSFSMAVDDVRYYLKGMLWEIETNLFKVVSTDGLRMSISENIVDNKLLSEKIKAIVPRKAIAELEKIINRTEDSIYITLDDNHIKAKFNNFEFISKLVDGEYPNYNMIIPKFNEKVLSVNKQLFKDSLERTSILANSKFKSVNLDIKDNNITLSTKNMENEVAKEIIDANYRDEEIKISFNYRYLLDIVNVISSENIYIYLESSSMSILVKDQETNSMYILMPIKN